MGEFTENGFTSEASSNQNAIVKRMPQTKETGENIPWHTAGISFATKKTVSIRKRIPIARQINPEETHHEGWRWGWRNGDMPTELKVNGVTQDFNDISAPHINSTSSK